METDNTLTGSEQPATPTEQAADTAQQPEAKTDTTEQSAEGSPAPDTKPADEQSEDDAKDKPKQRSRARERIEQLARDLKNARRREARLNQEVGRLRAEQPPASTDIPGTMKRASREAALDTQADGLRTEIDEIAEARKQAWADRAKEIKERIPDFEKVFDDSVPISPQMADFILDSELDGEMANYLAHNRDEALRIYRMEPLQAERALTRLEARLTASPRKQFSQAPAPVPTVGGKSHTATKSLSDTDYDDYKARRMAQLKEKAKAGGKL